MENVRFQNQAMKSLVLLVVLFSILSLAPAALGQCVADFTADQTTGCATLTVIFTDKSPNATSWWWSFQGGSPATATGKGPHKVKYATPGKFDVKLDIACQLGKDSIIKEDYITVNQCACEADFSANPTTACVGENIVFTDNSPTADTWIWSFPGGTPSSAQTKGPHTVKYNKPGDYTVTLQVYCGNYSDTETKTNYIHIDDCTCEANFSAAPTTACVSEVITFTDQSPHADSWYWSFPGGDPSSAQTRGPHYVKYAQPGQYDVTLKVYCGINYDIETKEDYIQINDCTCNADFYGTPTSGEAPLKVIFTDNSSPNAVNWTWTFPGGEPAAAQGKGPHQVIYYQEGYYNVKLGVQCPVNSDVILKEKYIYVFKQRFEFGDAPEGALAYPSSGVIGKFPTCKDVGPAGFIKHDAKNRTFLGPGVDYETDGNGGLCPSFNPDSYNHDETAGDGDCGVDAGIFTIQGPLGSETVVPIISTYWDSIGYACEFAKWGKNLDLWFDTDHAAGAYVNVLIDWNQDGEWGGFDVCPGSTGAYASEHILRNFHVPNGNGFLSALDPPDFQIGTHVGFVWARFTITTEEIGGVWHGEGEFDSGETEDHLLWVGSRDMRYDFGDAPLAYGTLFEDNGAHHLLKDHVFLGKLIDADPDGQADTLALGDDNDGIDDEDGVTFSSDTLIIGDTITVAIDASVAGYLKAGIDYNQDGDWNDPGETIFDNTQVGSGVNTFMLPLPDDAKEGRTYSRFRYSDEMIERFDGPSNSGEVEDYVLQFILKSKYEYGDAPEAALAYPHTGQMGAFPTCEYISVYSEWYGTSGFIRHGFRGFPVNRYFGASADLEKGGNNGLCAAFYPDQYDQDETYRDGDAGFEGPVVYTIRGEDGSVRLIPVGGSPDIRLLTCDEMHWGDEMDISYTVNSDAGAYINVLVDWNQDGRWTAGHISCGVPVTTREHLVKNQFVPRGTGKLSDHILSRFWSGPDDGYIWMRFSITEREVPLDDDDHWDGSGIFSDGETEDYLVYFNGMYARDFGDAPDSALAYPATGQFGFFPTCLKGIPASPGYIEHDPPARHHLYFGLSGSQPTDEYNGNHGFCTCTGFHHFNKDQDNGLMLLKPYTLSGPEGAETVIEDPYSLFYIDWDTRRSSLGMACQLARWGTNIDMAWTNETTEPAYVNVLIDWNQDGYWSGSVSCPGSMKALPEHVLQNFEVGAATSAPSLTAWTSGLSDFRIGPNSGYVWARFTITAEPVELPWDGTGSFEDGETEDYLLKIQPNYPLIDYGDAIRWYRTLEIDGGAIHRVNYSFCLGDTIDPDPDGQCDPEAKGDDNDGTDDEDGVEFKTALKNGQQATIEIKASTVGVLNGWIDFNADSSWDDSGEHFIVDHQASAGTNLISFTVPASAKQGKTYARFRFSDVGGLTYYGPRLDEQSAQPPVGEVEDYLVTIGEPTAIDAQNPCNASIDEFRLMQNYPNPFNPSTEIQYTLPKTSHVHIAVYNLMGHELKVLVKVSMPAGNHTIQWDGKDSNGKAMPTGIYIYKITAGDFTCARKLLLVK
ncbi:PKD domain-containing protein [candidate division KSB1 bacterium]|nr:PKD domain-containing protein [candidate division KSB1 bacterium]